MTTPMARSDFLQLENMLHHSKLEELVDLAGKYAAPQ